MATGFAGFVGRLGALAVDFAGLAVGLRATAVTFLAAFGATVLPTGAFFGATFFGAAFFGAAFFATGFFTAVFLTVLAAALPLAGTAAFFAAGLPTTAFLATAVFGTALRLAAAFFGAALARAGLTAALGLLFRTSFALPAAFAFCGLAAVELRVVFAISLHQFWPWRPGVIAYVSPTGNHASEILATLHATSGAGSVNAMTRLILLLLAFYKRWLSPLLGPRCRFHPSCSDYARIAVVRFGPWRGSLLAGWRLLRCQPLCDGGNDPVPERFHFARCHHRDDSSRAP